MNQDFLEDLIGLYNDHFVSMSNHFSDIGGEPSSSFWDLVNDAAEDFNTYGSVIAPKLGFDEDEFFDLLETVDEDVCQALTVGLILRIGSFCTDSIDENAPGIFCVYNIDLAPNCVAVYLLSRAFESGGETVFHGYDTGDFEPGKFLDVMERIQFLVDGWDFRVGKLKEEDRNKFGYYKTGQPIGRFFNEWHYYKTKQPVKTFFQLLDSDELFLREYDSDGDYEGTELTLELSAAGIYNLYLPGDSRAFNNKPLEESLIELIRKSRVFIKCWEPDDELYDCAAIWVGIYEK